MSAAPTGVLAVHALPSDILAEICAHLDLFAAERLLSTCRGARAIGADDTFFRAIAHKQWGHEFWRDALTRPTTRVFVSMRDELRQLHRFQKQLESLDVPMWTDTEFRAFWRYERDKPIPPRAARRRASEGIHEGRRRACE